MSELDSSTTTTPENSAMLFTMDSSPPTTPDSCTLPSQKPIFIVPPRPNPFIFTNGDVRMQILSQNELFIGQVSSYALSVASPVWNKFLFPPWATSPSPVAELDFREDDSDALFILLNIVHLRFDRVPNSLSYELLLRIAVLCDKYDCIQIVRPWQPFWLRDELKEALRMGQENWLFIAYVFGRMEVFDRLATKMVLDIKKLPTGVFLNGTGYVIEDIMPPGILDFIQRIRHEAIANLLRLAYDEVDRYSQCAAIKCHYGNEGCDAMAYGSLILGLERVALWPRVSAMDLGAKFGLSTIANYVKSLRNHQYPATIHEDMSIKHNKCAKASFRRDVEDIMDHLDNPMLQSHYIYMGRQ